MVVRMRALLQRWTPKKKKTGLNVGVAMDKKWAGIPFFWHERSQGCSPVKKKEKKRKNKFERWVSVRRDELKKERKKGKLYWNVSSFCYMKFFKKKIPVSKWVSGLCVFSGGFGATWPPSASPWAAALSTLTRARTASGALIPLCPPRRATRAATCPRPTRTGPRSGSVWTEKD